MVSLRRGIAWQRSSTWYWQDRAGVARTRSVHVERRTTSLAFLGWVDRLWLGRRKAARRRYLASRRRVAVVGRVAHMALWLCIHSGEGNSHPSRSHPYSGPLQMTSYWAGYPIYDWAAVPVGVVYADAEAQLQIHLRRGDVYAWLAQQCAAVAVACRARSRGWCRPRLQGDRWTVVTTLLPRARVPSAAT